MEKFVTVFQIMAFLSLLAGFVMLLRDRFLFIRRNILLGKAFNEKPNPESQKRNMILMAFGQKKMFDRPTVGILHLFVYIGFIVINAEVLEIILDGLTGQHRIFSPLLGKLYPLFISKFELLALGVVVSCAIFFLRRNMLKIPRFHSAEMKGWAYLDANLILTFEIVLMGLLYTMNATDCILQERNLPHYQSATGEPMRFLVSQLLIPIYNGFGDTTLIFIERSAWWLHIIGIFGFGIYVTYSKHLHIFLAFPNTYYARQQPKGEIENMDSITKEVKIAMGLEQDNGTPAEIGRFGAKDVQDLTWKNLMDAYACTECGRCTSQCPANLTGKKLSPRKIMMDTRDRLEEVGENIDRHHGEFKEDGKSLYGDYITKEELNACTTCNACVEACPINISPLDIILQLRRYAAMEEASVPDAWKSMLSNVQNNGAPWAFAASDRFKWADEMKASEK